MNTRKITEVRFAIANAIHSVNPGIAMPALNQALRLTTGRGIGAEGQAKLKGLWKRNEAAAVAKTVPVAKAPPPVDEPLEARVDRLVVAKLLAMDGQNRPTFLLGDKARVIKGQYASLLKGALVVVSWAGMGSKGKPGIGWGPRGHRCFADLDEVLKVE